MYPPPVEPHDKVLMAHEDGSSMGTDVPRASALMELVYPVSTVYVTGTATNPATFLQFGTWVQVNPIPPIQNIWFWSRTI